TCVDSSALDHEVMLVSGGRRGLSVELAPADLIRVIGATTAAIAD
ncbi:MAG: Cys-tRNA(Pro) deacylase, partial [Acidipropionibacterium jensenii]|nr:Cys-tRNA(Pro) deacylase [Acidipropionibacterium jensenii]